MQRYVGRLAFKISAFTSLVILIVMASVLSVLVVNESSQIRGEITANAQAYARLTSEAYYQTYIQNYTRPQSQDFVDFSNDIKELLADNTDIKNVSLVSVSGRIMYDSDEVSKGKYSGEPRRITDEALLEMLKKEGTSQHTVNQGGKTMLEILQTVPEISGGHIFVVRYLVSFDSLQTRIGTIYREAFLIAAVLLPLSIGLAILFSIPITRPITRLTKATQRLGSGNFNELDINTKSRDEIGQLTRSFMLMAGDIRNSRGTIESQNQQLFQEQARLSASINSLALGYIMTDHTDNVVVINQAAKTILGHNQNHQSLPVGSEYTLPVIAGQLASAIDLSAKIAECKARNTTFTVDELAWGDRFLHIFISPIVVHTHDNAGMVIIIEDTTELTVIQRSKNEFFAVAAHELRTPLAVMTGNISLIQKYNESHGKDTAVQECADRALTAGTRMGKLMDDFLDVSSLEQGSVVFDVRPFDIVALTHEVADRRGATQPPDHSTTLTITGDPSVTARADEQQTTEVLDALIDNAYKATPAGDITINITSSEGAVRVEITDTGVGIATELQPLLFHKLQSTGGNIMNRGSDPGAGLGLYIARLLVEGMDGTLILKESAPGRGSCFVLTLPAANPA